MKILLVDDDVTTLDRLRNDVAWDRLQITQQYYASSAAMAQGILERHTIDILLCDIEMPMESGLQLIKWIRDRDWDMVCLILTAHAQFSFAQEAVNLSVEAYILKPIDIVQLESEIEKVATRRGRGEKDNKRQAMDSTDDTLVEKVKHYICDKYTEDISTAALSAHFSYNADYLTRVFKKHENITPLEYLSRFRLGKACAFLCYTNLSVSEIAMMVGFNSSSYFATLFRATYGMSPAQYRKSKHSGSVG